MPKLIQLVLDTDCYLNIDLITSVQFTLDNDSWGEEIFDLAEFSVEIKTMGDAIIYYGDAAFFATDKLVELGLLDFESLPEYYKKAKGK